MLKKLSIMFAMLLGFYTNAQVGIGTASPDSSAALEVRSTTAGVLIPRVSTAQRDAINSPATGLMVFNSTTNAFEFFNGTVWGKLSPDVDESKWTNESDSSYVYLTNQSDGTTARTAGTEVVVTDLGRLGINTRHPKSNLQIKNMFSVWGVTSSGNEDRFVKVLLNPNSTAYTGSRQIIFSVDAALQELYWQSYNSTVDGTQGASGVTFARFSLNAPASSLFLNNLGNLGIGINPTASYKLYANGDIKANGDVYSNSTALTSDARLKSNIETVQNGLGLISKLNPVHYTKRSVNESTSVRNEYGFIAQEVRELMPELIFGEETDSTYLSLDYNSFIAILTKGIQEQSVIIDNHQSQIDALTARLDRLEASETPKVASASMTMPVIILAGLLTFAGFAFFIRRKLIA